MARDTKIDSATLDALLKDRDPQKVFDSDGLLGDLKKALAEAAALLVLQKKFQAMWQDADT